LNEKNEDLKNEVIRLTEWKDNNQHLIKQGNDLERQLEETNTELAELKKVHERKKESHKKKKKR